MKINIDEEKLSKSNMSPTEVLTLKVLKDHECLAEILETLQNAGFVVGFNNDNITFLSITNSGKMLLDRLVEEKSESEEFEEDQKRLTEIANAIIDIYPNGYKKMIANGQVVDSPYVWRGSVRMIRDRLAKFEHYFYEDKKLDINDVVEATQRYCDKQKKVDEYPFILTYMKTLKYFIYKDGESDLLNYLETEEGEDVYTFDEANGMTIL